MKLFVPSSLLTLCAVATAFTPQPLATQNGVGETALFSSAWWDNSPSIRSTMKPSGAPQQFGAIQRAPGAPARLIPPQAWQNFSPQGKTRVEGQSRKYRRTCHYEYNTWNIILTQVLLSFQVVPMIFETQTKKMFNWP